MPYIKIWKLFPAEENAIKGRPPDREPTCPGRARKKIPLLPCAHHPSGHLPALHPPSLPSSSGPAILPLLRSVPAPSGAATALSPESAGPQVDILKWLEYPHCKAHCADSVVVITRRCQRLNPGSSPGRRILPRWERRCVLLLRKSNSP